MLKKTITYLDLNDNEVTEDHYFHLTKADLVEMQMSHNDVYEKDGEQLTGLRAWLQKIIDANDGAQIMAEFKKLILNSYGIKSDDGKSFKKNMELRQEFEMSEAYSAIFMELCTDAQAASDFVNGIIPRGLVEDEQVQKIQDKPQTPQALAAPRGVRGDAPVARPAEGGPGVPRVLTRKEVLEMPQEELSHLLATGEAVIGSEG